MISETEAIYNDPGAQKTFFGHYPAGASLYQWEYMSKMMNHPDDFIDFDWGEKLNIEKYGQKEPRKIDFKEVEKAGVPIAMVAGIHDMIVYPVDTKWVRDNLGEVLVEYVEVNGGHTTFFLGKDMSFVQNHILKWMKVYNPLSLSAN